MSATLSRHIVVIGLGGTGKKMLRKLHEVVGEEGLQKEKVHYLSIDSKKENSDELEFLTPEEEIALDWESRNWENKQLDYPYLESGDRPDEMGGVGRNRRAARAMLDDQEQFDRLYPTIQERIDKVARENPSAEIDIWLLTSLGGGTGSGIFPLVSAMTQQALRGGAGQDTKTKLRALTALPRISDIEQNIEHPDVNKTHLLNTFMALSELEGIVQHDSTNPTSAIDIDLTFSENNRSQKINAEQITLDPEEFTDLFLLGVDENDLDSVPTYEDATLRVVAYWITALGQHDNPDNYPSENDIRNKLAYSIDAAGLRFPHSTAASYILHDREITAIEENYSLIEDKLEERAKTAATYLESIITVGNQHNPDTTNINVGKLYDYCEEQANSDDIDTLARINTNDGKEVFRAQAENIGQEVANDPDEKYGVNHPFDNVEDVLDDLDSNIAEKVSPTNDHEGRQPAKIVGKYLYLAALQERLNQKARRNKFESLVEDLWREHSGKIEDSEFYEEDDAEDKWEDSLRSWIDQRIKELEEKSGLIRDYSDEIEELEETQSEISKQRDERSTIRSLRNEVGTAIENARDEIRQLASQYSEMVSSANDHKADIEMEADSKRSQRDEAAAELREFETQVDFAEVKVSNPENLRRFASGEHLNQSVEEVTSAGLVPEEQVPEDADDAGELVEEGLLNERTLLEWHLKSEYSLKDFESKDVVEKSELNQNLRHMLNYQVEERTQDLGGGTEQQVLPQARKADGWRSQASDIFSNLPKYGIEGIDDAAWEYPPGVPTTIRLMVQSTSFDLENTSEFGVLQDWYEDPDANIVEELYGDTVSDEVAVQFAYPELVDMWQESQAAPVGED